MVDAADLKSAVAKAAYGFDSRPRHSGNTFAGAAGAGEAKALDTQLSAAVNGCVGSHPHEQKEVRQAMTARGPSALFILTALFSASAGCAFGQRQSFANVQVAVTHRGTTAIALAAHDRRPYVVNGEKSPTYVGTQRGGFGNPFDVTTKSDAALATEFAAVLRRSLSAMGYRVSTVGTRPRLTRAQITAALAQTKATRLILLTVNEWTTDTYNSTDLSYDLVLEVLDGSGRVLARWAVKGEDSLGTSLFNPQAVAREAAPQALQAKLSSLINNASVAAAVKETGPPAAVAQPPEDPYDRAVGGQ
jgi:hypothetical protein